MSRIHLFEFTDLPWYPQTFRRIQTDYLQFVASRGSAHLYLLPVLMKAMRQAGTKQIVDLCSGAAGPWVNLQEQFKRAGWEVRIWLTDKYPHPEAVQKWPAGSTSGITYCAEPVDAMHVPGQLSGMRTLFEGFHHFKPDQARLILMDAVETRAAIGVFEITLKPPLGLPFLYLLGPLTTIIAYLLLTPFIQPRTVSRFFWTYLLPIVPLATCWDGIISLLRVYSQKELCALTASLGRKNYAWEVGTVSTATPIFEYIYLTGYPVDADLTDHQPE